MPYAVASDIQSEFKKLDLSSSKSVTTAEVTEFILQTSADMDMKLAVRYETPVTGTQSLLILKKIAISLVAFRIANILNLKREVPIPDGRVVQTLNYTSEYKEAQKTLDQIFKGDVILPDASELSSNTGIASYNAQNSILPEWELDTKQW